MSRFDIYANSGRNRRDIPFLVDVQNNLISGLATRIVVPLRPLVVYFAASPPSDLFPLIAVHGEQHVFDCPQLAAIPLKQLKILVATAQAYQFAIQSALDRLFGAY
ncbi:CcdB family protein [Duganella fentianensis]|uniref:CcdB family protein n=1 Tax=Duganella fentianensis TaxID=2692177 RepID=UPI0032B267B4